MYLVSACGSDGRLGAQPVPNTILIRHPFVIEPSLGLYIWLTETNSKPDIAGLYNEDSSNPAAKSGTTNFNTVPTAAAYGGGDYATTDLYRPNDVRDIAAYLSKPYLSHTGSWAATDVRGTNLYFADSRFYYLPAIKANKLRGFYGMRGTLCVKLDINSTPYHAGRLRLSYYPNYSENPRKGSAHLSNFIPVSQLPGVDVEANETSVLLRIPYLSVLHFIELTGPFNDWGRVFLHVASPLATGPDNAQSVNYRIWTWIEDVELFGQTATVLTQGPSKRRAVPSDKEVKPISTFFSELSNFAGRITNIPVVGAYAGTVSWASAALSGAASAFGWSKPNAPMQVARVYQNPAQSFPQGNAVDTAIPLSVESSAKLRTLTEFSPDGQDEMSIAYIKSQYSYLESFQLGTATLPGAQLWQRELKPVDFQLTLAPDEVYKTPVSYLTEMFRYYRGGLKWMFKVAKTGFHRGQIAITYVPGPCPNTISIDDTAYAYREIYDLATGNFVCVETPWMVPLDYLRADTGFGRIFVHCVNPLQAPETVSTSVVFDVYVAGANDLEVGAPCEPRYVPVFTQGPTGPDVTDTAECEIDGTVGGAPGNQLGVIASQNAMSEIVLSLSSLLKRHSHFGLLQNVNEPLVRFYPWGLQAGFTVASSNPFNTTLQSYILSAFAFMRGSVVISTKRTGRVVDVTAQPGERVNDLVAFTTYNTFDPIYVAAPVAPEPASGPRGTSAYTHVSASVGSLSVQVPYQCPTRVTPVRYQRDATDVPEYNCPMPQLTISRPWYPGGMTRAYGDDFQALFFVGIPRLGATPP